MIQGTMSGDGKSLICAGLCRFFYRERKKVTSFKSQNISSASCVLDSGKQMALIQSFQSEAAGTQPNVWMNPILYKVGEAGCDIYLNGEKIGQPGKKLCTFDFNQQKKYIRKAVSELKKQYEIIVAEGAGSPVEMNLKKKT